MIKKVKVTIEGIRPYLQHRRPSSQQEVEQMSKIIKILQKNPFDAEASRQEAEMSAYKNSQGYYIPAEQIQEALTNAGARLQVKGQGKRTYKDYMKSYVFVEPEEILITPQQYQIDSRYVKVQRSGIIRNRPRFDNWKATFNLLITDDTLPLKDIQEILEIAGSRIGIGDYRPRYGLFTVTKFEETQVKE
jgi:hypothetical protein